LHGSASALDEDKNNNGNDMKNSLFIKQSFLNNSSPSGCAAPLNAERLSIADHLLNVLQGLGVDYIFGVPGGAIEPFYNALYHASQRGDIQQVTMRHENSAAFAADGYYRETGKLGVCCTTTGPGATNMITAVASAKKDKSPMLVITAQTNLNKFGRNALQDSSCTGIDTVAIYNECTKYSTLISDPAQFHQKLMTALIKAFSPPMGPVHLSIPSELFTSICPEDETLMVPTIDLAKNTINISMVDKLNTRVTTLLDNNKAISFYVGDVGFEAGNCITAYAESIGATITTSPMGKRWIKTTSANYCGVFGFAGHATATRALKWANTIIAFGADFKELDTNNGSDALMNHKLIHIDSDLDDFKMTTMAHMQVYGDIITIVNYLLQQRPPVTRPIGQLYLIGAERDNFSVDAVKDNSETSRVHPARLMQALVKIMPTNSRYLVDAGNSWAWATHYLNLQNHPHYYRIAMGYGSMTWSIGAGIGTAVACIEEQAHVVCITGDGAYLMAGQELTVAVEHQLSVIFVILNDASLGMVKHGQQMGNAMPIAHNISPVNFAMMAHAMGAQGMVISNQQQLNDLDLTPLLAHAGPIVIDVSIDGKAEPPIGERVKSLIS
jgi:acetolactate synthase-1/2/3 large subunit